MRLHTFERGKHKLWADRVPAIHGMVNLYTLWERDGPECKQLIGGVTITQLREYLSGGAS